MTPDTMVRLVDQRCLWGTPNAIYAVPTPLRGIAYLRVARTPYCNDERTVVIADAARFLAAWRIDAGPRWRGQWMRLTDHFRGRSPERNKWLPHLSPRAWANDYKFGDAEDGFSQGRDNPVPLAEVGLGGRVGVGFTNGITRTLWLLVQQAHAFPVECRTSSSSTLHALIGQPGTTPQTVDALTRGIALYDRPWPAP